MSFPKNMICALQTYFRFPGAMPGFPAKPILVPNFETRPLTAISTAFASTMKTYMVTCSSTVVGLALAAFSGAVLSQSSVEIYGVVDVGLQHADNGVRKLNSEISNGSPQGSRVGFRGVEDLGDGLKARFVLESGLNPNNGTQSDSARFFNRLSYAGLLSRWGELRLGRDYTPTYNLWGTFEPYGGNGVASLNRLTPARSNQGTVLRADNSVQYRLPSTLGGVYGELMATAGENTPTPTGNSYRAGRLGYASGPINVAFAHAQTKVVQAFEGSKVKESYLGGSYDFVFLKLGFNAGRRALGTNTLRTYQLSLTAPVGQFGTLKATIGRLQNNSATIDDAKQFTLGYVYALSQRTILYATAARVQNDPAAAYAAGALPAVAGKNYAGYESGIRLTF